MCYLTYVARVNITISVDPAFVAYMDEQRGGQPRSRWLEGRPDLSSPGAQRRQDTSRRAAQPPSGQRENRADAFRAATQKRKP